MKTKQKEDIIIRYFSSDWHLGHKNILEHSNRPFETIEEMEEVLIANWNEVVTPDDVGYLIGDTFWTRNVAADCERAIALRKRLNGTVIFMPGNHDEKIVRRVEDSDRDIQTCKWEGQHFFLFHYPALSWNRSHHGSIMLHGHTHQSSKLTFHPAGKPLVHVGVDAWDYKPASASEILELVPRNRTPD